ncbi:AgmX/PglI C-terminal domain-containing protein [Sorangium sp. So ce1097]|uniref:AgmX/PglI C-terminal domain-containing protein n=1 Tax=Sorangium sp. So ce1097 TaxID=3133330 RepID=UPI003F6490AA
MPPSSQQIPGKSGNSGLYIAGMVVLAALMAGLLYWKLRPEPTAPTAAPTAAAPLASKPADPPPLFAPPPPPPVDEVEDAGADAGKVASGGQGPAATGKSPCSGKCGDGASSPALDSAVLGLARSAQGCYNRALRTSEVSGKLTVSVQVASTGAVCSASILNDSVGSNEIASCVLGRFRGKSLPPPQSGCVVVNVPINFTIKQ